MFQCVWSESSLSPMELATTPTPQCVEAGDEFRGESTAAAAGRTTSPVHKMLEVQSLYKPTPPHQPSAKRRRLRLTSVPLVDLRASEGGGGCGGGDDLYGSLNSPPRSLSSDVDAASLSSKSGGICSLSEGMDTPKAATSSVRIKHLTSSWESESRFPKLNECAHFHYEFVELGPINVCILDEAQENSKLLANGALEKVGNFSVQVSSNGKCWVVRRSYENFRMLDHQLHQCIYDRKFSALNEIPKEYRVDDDDTDNSKENIIQDFSEYLQRFSDIAGNLINCGPILNWLELDNRGNRLIVTDDSAINTPAVAAAYVTKRYIAQATDEISFEVGDMISVIDMPPPEESIWWRGKRGFEVGFFPSECVEVIGDKVPHSIHIPKAPTKPVLRKHGKLIAFFRSFILSRPSRRKLKQSGILKERVFGCDLGEHLLNSGRDIPMVLKCCAEFIEAHGIVDGIYRLSGVTSNIQKIRNTFDEERVPDLNDEAILHDIHCVASLLKMYFRELPNPLLTYQLYDKFVFAVQSDDDVRLLNVRDVVQQLPPPHYRTLEYLVRHLSRVAAHGAETGMTPKNVAIVWAPNLLRSKDLEIGGVAALQVVGVQAVVTEFLIHYSDLIFNDKMPTFSPCLESTGTPKRNRPKSLAISTPTKLLSLEEARSRALGAIQYNQKYIEVGGGPSMLPNKYHTVIELPDRKRGGSKHKKSPSGWKSFFSKSKSTQQSTRERDKSKSRRKGSSTPSDPGISIGLTDKAVTEADISQTNNNRLRSVKSAESLISSAANSQRNSDAIDGANAHIEGNGSEDLLSSSLGAVSSAQLRQSPHSHIRSISHDSYFEFSFDRHQRGDQRPGELATITSEENDEEQERLVLDDFIRMHYVDQDSESSVTCQTDELPSSTINEVTTFETSDKITGSSTPVYAPIRDVVDDSEDTFNKFGTETLQEQSSIDSDDDDHSDIVGDIQQEVAAALHWDQPPYLPMDTDSITTTASDKCDINSPTKFPVADKTPDPESRVVVERFGSEKTVVVEVHAFRENEDDTPTDAVVHSDIVLLNSVNPTTVVVASSADTCQNDFPASSLALYDSLEAGQINLVSDSNLQSVCESEFSSDVIDGFYPDSLECGDLICSSVDSRINECAVSEINKTPIHTTKNESFLVNGEFTSAIEQRIDSQPPLHDANLIQVCDSSSDKARECEKRLTTVVIISSRGIDLLTGDDIGSDSSHGETNEEISSTSSPGSAQDPFGYSVLINEDEAITPVKEDLIQLNLDTNPPVNHSEEVVEDWVVVDAGKDGIEVKILAENMSTDSIKLVNESSCFNNVVETVTNADAALPKSHSEAQLLQLSSSPVVADYEQTPFVQRLSAVYADKLSPVEESKRKFESEIGRDILRERKMKLELEKIQLEQQRSDKCSPEKVNESSVCVVSSSKAGIDSDVELNDVELRHQKDGLRDSLLLEDSKRASEPVSSSAKPEVIPNLDGNKRHSEPGFKSVRPERKASVKELMSKFERKPKPETQISNVAVSDCKTINLQSSKVFQDPIQTQGASLVDHYLVHDPPHSELDSKKKSVECVAAKVSSRSEESLESEQQRTIHSQSPTEENSLMTVSLEGGLDKQLYDQARRERIDRYKEERRAQLRERIRSESFREQDSSNDYLLRLKQKATSPAKTSSEKLEDGCGLPVSPRRRARLSAVAYGHSTDDYKPDSYLSRRRSFNARSSSSSSSVTSPTTGCEPLNLSMSDRSRLREKSAGKAATADQRSESESVNLEGAETVHHAAETSHKSSRPNSLKQDTSAISKVPKKSSPVEGPSGNRIKSPMKERSNNVPLSPTMDILTANNELVKKDSRLRYSDNENPNLCRTKCSKSGSGPTPPPRKIKDVAALFEPERLPKQQQQPDSRSKESQQVEESEAKVRPYQRPFSATHVQTRPKTVSSYMEEDGHGFAFPSSSTTPSVYKLKPKKQTSP